MPVQRLNVAFLPPDLPCSGPITHSGEMLTSGKSHRKKTDRFFLNDDTDVKKVLGFKYATWNTRGLGEKEEELDQILNENNIKSSVQGTKETEHYTVIYSGVDRHVRGQSRFMIWIHKSISNKIDHYKFWNDRFIETRLKIQRGHVTILAVYGVTESRDELNEEFYEKPQKILDKVNKNNYIILIGDMNARVGNNRVANIVGTNGEATLISIGRKLIDFCTFNNLKIMNIFFKHKEIHKFTWEARGHKSIIDYFITNMKTSKLIQDIRVYRSNEQIFK